MNIGRSLPRLEDAALLRGHGRFIDDVNLPLLRELLVEHGADIQFVGELRRSLEDVYLTLVNPQKEN